MCSGRIHRTLGNDSVVGSCFPVRKLLSFIKVFFLHGFGLNRHILFHHSLCFKIEASCLVNFLNQKPLVFINARFFKECVLLHLLIGIKGGPKNGCRKNHSMLPCHNEDFNVSLRRNTWTCFILMGLKPNPDRNKLFQKPPWILFFQPDSTLSKSSSDFSFVGLTLPSSRRTDSPC